MAQLEGAQNRPARAENQPFYWAEYPDRDVEYVRWYPCVLRALSEEEVWRPSPAALYIHIPFCNQLCASCPYNKTMTTRPVADRYVGALEREIDLAAEQPYVQDCEFCAAYVGGGTPTALAADQLGGILERARRRFRLAPGVPITVESTPFELDARRAEVLMRQGVTRVSIGVQTFDDALLRRIHRSHTREMIYSKLELLRRTGFREIGVDLMYGLPGQTPESWSETIREFLALDVESVSLYCFLLLPGSELFRRVREGREPPPPPPGEIDAMHSYGAETLMGRGYVACSNCDFGNDRQIGGESWESKGVVVYPLGASNYRGLVVPTFPRLKYLSHLWYDGGELLSLGAGAYGYIRDHAYLNEPDLERYARSVEAGRLPHAMGCYVSPIERMARSMVLGIKLLRVCRKDFARRHGVDMAVVFGDQIRRLEQQGLVRLTGEWLELTYPKGWLYQDNVSKAFYTQANYRLPQPSPTNTGILRFLKKGLDYRNPKWAGQVQVQAPPGAPTTEVLSSHA